MNITDTKNTDNLLPPLDAPNIINDILAVHKQMFEAYGEDITKENLEDMNKNYINAIDRLKGQIDKQKEMWLKDPNPNHAWGYEWLIELIQEEIDQCRHQIKILKWRQDRLVNPELAGEIKDTDIARAKEVKIEQLITGTVKRRSNKVYIICPFHDDHHPSGLIYLDQNSYACYACNTTAGDVIEFVQKRDKVGFVEAIKYLANI